MSMLLLGLVFFAGLLLGLQFFIYAEFLMDLKTRPHKSKGLSKYTRDNPLEIARKRRLTVSAGEENE